MYEKMDPLSSIFHPWRLWTCSTFNFCTTPPCFFVQIHFRSQSLYFRAVNSRGILHLKFMSTCFLLVKSFGSVCVGLNFVEINC